MLFLSIYEQEQGNNYPNGIEHFNHYQKKSMENGTKRVQLKSYLQMVSLHTRKSSEQQ
uniref:Uncharacterized protein n=1 Tax=Arion vulgaris TaxID=1028688 RepID=A0A0B6ZB19_9EUPU